MYLGPPALTNSSPPLATRARARASSAEFSKLTVWVLCQISFQLLPAMAVFDGVPQHKIELVRGARRASPYPCSGEDTVPVSSRVRASRREPTVRILLEINMDF